MRVYSQGTETVLKEVFGDVVIIILEKENKIEARLAVLEESQEIQNGAILDLGDVVSELS